MEDFLNAVAGLFSNPDGQKIIIRVLSIIGTGLGLRVLIRWGMHMFTKRSRKYISDYSDHVVVPTQLTVAMVTAYIYRWEIIPTGEVFHDGHLVDSHKIVFLSLERILAEGIFYGLGSIAMYGLGLYLMKRYKIIK